MAGTYGGMLFTETITLHEPGTPSGKNDRYGKPILDPPHDYTAPAWFELAETSENEDNAATVIDGYWIYLPDTWRRMTAQWEVTLPGVGRFRIDGEPGYQPGGFALAGYVRARLRRARG